VRAELYGHIQPRSFTGQSDASEVEQFEETHVLREESEVYGFKSAVFWNESFEDART
jgi:hypothetical protein